VPPDEQHEEEWRAYHQSVSAWEIENYLKLY